MNLAEEIISELRSLHRTATERGEEIVRLEAELATANRERWLVFLVGIALGVWATFMFFGLTGWWR